MIGGGNCQEVIEINTFDCAELQEDCQSIFFRCFGPPCVYVNILRIFAVPY